MSDKIVAIVGRPNVGKSSLFNRLIGEKVAIVDDMPGVTRDRNYGKAEWNGKTFFLIDTGGYVPDSKDMFESAIREQVKISIDEADIVLFVVDAKSGLMPLDIEIGRILRKEVSKKEYDGKKVILAVNKVDGPKDENAKSDFYKLGLGEPMEVSALVGRRSGDLLDAIADDLGDVEPVVDDESIIKIAIIGRPNVGKSSITNALTNSNRNIVTNIPGTTRDSIDTTIKYHGKEIILIDTAGLRKKNKIAKAESLEFYSAIRTHRAIERCDVAVIVIDAASIEQQLSKNSDPKEATFKLNKEDVDIIREAADLKKGILIVVNKWDLIEKDSNTAALFELKVKEHLQNFAYLPFLFTSVITNQRVAKITDEALKVYDERAREIKTSELNNKLSKIIEDTPPRSKTHRELKINYITQLRFSPPIFGFFTNLPDEIEENYKRFLENKMRGIWGFTGVPITLVFKKKN